MQQANRYRWTSGGATDRGRLRARNQDAFLDQPDRGLWAVADGMGGHQDGGRASQLLVQRLGSLTTAELQADAVAAVTRVLQQANTELWQASTDAGGDIIGSTVVVMSVAGRQAALLWAGDSRAYRLREGILAQLTRDHSQVQTLVDHGLLSAAEAERHPFANVLARAIGGERAIQIDSRVEPIEAGDRYLLCSDGLTRELSLPEITRLLASDLSAPDRMQQIAGALVQTACAAGGRDNVTAVVIDMAAD
ncbi:MAG: serine/threonine-protein phosphatase [Chromatiaceae bacterium]|nr:MAG: serine/threonine-protein phosphatase [Chromatiaceae bacterium]